MATKVATKGWTNFKRIKEAVSMEQILEHYGLLENLRRKGEELVGYCPIHDQKHYNKDAFSVNTKRQIFHCFACGVSGNVLSFVMAVEGVKIREAGLLLQEWFDLEPQKQRARKGKKKPFKPEKKAQEKTRESKAKEKGQEEHPKLSENPPSTFALKSLDPSHSYLKERGLSQETVKEFGLGFCKRALMKGRIAIPIHNEKGELVAYAGRYPGQPPEGEPKYKLPPKFKKHQVLFNLQRVKELTREPGLILVEGFFDLFALWQAGFRNVVALMGTTMSKDQEELLLAILGKEGKLTLMLDADQAGRKGTEEIIERLLDKLYLKKVRLGEGETQPDSLSPARLKELLGE